MLNYRREEFHLKKVIHSDFTVDVIQKYNFPIFYLFHGKPIGFWYFLNCFPGFGDSQGEPTEEGLVEDGLAIYDWVKSRCGNASVFFWGHSLGTG